METSELKTALEFALDATWQAGRITLGYFQTGIAVERKSDSSPVTAADKSAEQKLREMIGKYYPDHGIIGEEYGRQAGKSDLTWIIDPIDGTKSFVCGVPIYGCLLALMEGETPIVGVAHYPAMNETVSAAVGFGASWNGRPARVSSVSSLSDAVMLASDIKPSYYAKPGYEAAFRRMIDATYIQRTWGDSYGYLLVSTGRADVMIDPVMNVWDCGPFGVILPEAGGTFTDWQGVPTIHAGEALATNGALLQASVELLK